MATSGEGPENNQTRAYTFKNPMGSRTRGRPPTSLMVKVTDSWLEYHEFKPSANKDPSCVKRSPVGGSWERSRHLNMVRKHESQSNDEIRVANSSTDSRVRVRCPHRSLLVQTNEVRCIIVRCL
ncbi:hypothetical protein TNCV_1503651 [Trichonephila clavipes]|uniref:Uncharacterized protein n=1 Tax=Trichonephila clavipes TaxID=2585209 RepID=A0A8X6VAA6_TRICX|nr:hypothetical protein TNCV_1503651 [Trichonephila clavipes]